MPFAVPSHMGLAAPLWRRWPEHFDAAAICVGAVMPDVVDGIVGATQGHLGQGIGHSFLGLALLCLPGGLAMWFAVVAIARRAPQWHRPHLLARCWNLGLLQVNAAPASSAFAAHRGTIVISIIAGDLTHLFFDVISHVECPWFYPWIHKLDIFPAWWSSQWFRMPVPGYGAGYPFGPHFISWLLLSVLGGIWLIQPALRSSRPSATPGDKQ